jgi:type IV pilus assembly protein PilB
MIIAAGPTGSGKTTTLLAALRYLTHRPLNLVTLEDPVESRITGISQVQINERAGLTFARGLRSILRQDPDVIMVGEIRDAETAELAIRAALTGHLVLTTIHTETLDGALVRLMDLGIEPYLVNAAVKGVLSQRLVKRTMGGRIGIFDLLTVTNEIQGWLSSGANVINKPNILKRDRMEQAARRLTLEGEIHKEEYFRLFGGKNRCSDSKADGTMNESLPDFARGLPDYYGAVSPSIPV